MTSTRRVGWVPVFLGLGAVALLVPAAGCGVNSARERSKFAEAVASAPAATSPAPGGEASAPTPAGEPTPMLPRKIIYNAQVTLVVESVATVAVEIARLVKEHGGYISETDRTSYTHSQRTATWKIRVPVDRFDAFLTAVGTLGEMPQSHLDSQDVSQEYYDLEARIANKQKEETRLQKHLADSTGKLEDILAVERELSRVRGEIEQAQGRHRFLSSQSALSTVTITASELKDYTPPIRPTFAARIGRTFQRSIDQLVEFGKNLLLVVVAVAPWLPIGALLLWPAWRLVRRRRANPR